MDAQIRITGGTGEELAALWEWLGSSDTKDSALADIAKALAVADPYRFEPRTANELLKVVASAESRCPRCEPSPAR